jgi:hypothetical protein
MWFQCPALLLNSYQFPLPLHGLDFKRGDIRRSKIRVLI